MIIKKKFKSNYLSARQIAVSPHGRNLSAPDLEKTRPFVPPSGVQAGACGREGSANDFNDRRRRRGPVRHVRSPHLHDTRACRPTDKKWNVMGKPTGSLITTFIVPRFIWVRVRLENAPQKVPRRGTGKNKKKRENKFARNPNLGVRWKWF